MSNTHSRRRLVSPDEASTLVPESFRGSKDTLEIRAVSESQRIVLAFLKSLNAKNPSALAKCVYLDFDWTDPLSRSDPTGKRVSGFDAVIATRADASWTESRVVSIIGHGELVMAETVGADEGAGIPSAWAFDLRDGKITHVRRY